MNCALSARLRKFGVGIGVCAAVACSSFAAAQQDQPKPTEKVTETEPLPKAEEILDRYVKETGGKEAYEQIKSMVITGEITLAMNMKGKMTVHLVRPGKLSSKVELAGIGEIRSGSDGETVWAMDPMQGPRILEGEEREMTLESAQISEEANWRERYKKFEVVGVENVKGKPAYKVELTDKHDAARTAFYDKESGLLVKQSRVTKTMQGEIPMDVFVSDYKKVGDLLVPHTTTMSAMGQEMKTTYDKIEFNVDIPAEKFELPKEVKELKDAKDKKEAEKGNGEKK